MAASTATAGKHSSKGTKGRDASRGWLTAWRDPLASLRVQAGNIATADLFGDGDVRLLVACDDKMLRVYAASRHTLEREVKLLDRPTALAVVFTEEAGPRLPAVAVAGGSYVFVYRNLRPFFKFTLPALPVDSRESQLWDRALETVMRDAQTGSESEDGEAGNTYPHALSPVELRRELEQLRDAGVALTITSADYLALVVPPTAGDGVLREYIWDRKVEARRLQRRNLVTCMATLPKNSHEPRALNQLVVGTESGEVYVLSPDAATVVTSAQVPSAPVFISTEGLFDVEYRILIACRDSKVYALRNGRVSTTVLEMESPIVSLAGVPRLAAVACMDKSVSGFHVRGRRQFVIRMPERVTVMCAVVIEEVNTVTALAIALGNGEIRLYREKDLILSTEADAENPDPAAALFFGPLGRESNCLVSVHDSGTLHVRILPRRVSLDRKDRGGPPPEQDIPLPIPKKTRLYVEQTRREREEGIQMYRTFQRDLYKLRLDATRRYVQCLSEGGSSAADVSGSHLRLHAEVSGIGPRFRVRLTLTNTSYTPARNLLVGFLWRDDQYELPEPTVPIAALLPQLPFVTAVPVRCVDPAGAPGGQLRVLVLQEGGTGAPLVSATVEMPQGVTEEELGAAA